jgi:hypothetical protein
MAILRGGTGLVSWIIGSLLKVGKNLKIKKSR